MKKFIFIIPITILISSFFINKSYAGTLDSFGYTIDYHPNYNADKPYGITIYYFDFDHWLRSSDDLRNNSSDNSFYYCLAVSSNSRLASYEACEDYLDDFLYNHPISNYSTDNPGMVALELSTHPDWIYVANIPYRWVPDGVTIYHPNNDPPEPEAGDTWLSDVWNWVLWQLGINDDYSGDIDAYITGGDRDPIEIVTPTPSLTPTPVPPYDLNITDPQGNIVYQITDIPSSSNNINITNYNDSSDFDIFAVDLKLSDGSTSNPRDGLNSVMDSSLDYLNENVDVKPVGDSFSVLPSDWFLIIGVIACFPFIAGFISKLLK